MTSDTATELAEVVQARIRKWHHRFYKDTPKLKGSRRVQPNYEFWAFVVPFIGLYLLFIALFAYYVGW